MTTKRYDAASIEKLRADPAARLLIARLRDRYGDYRLIGVAVTIDRDKSTREIDSLLFSCRALGRYAEDALLTELEKDTRAEVVQCMIGHYRPTKENALVADFFPTHGYIADSSEGIFKRPLMLHRRFLFKNILQYSGSPTCHDT